MEKVAPYDKDAELKHRQRNEGTEGWEEKMKAADASLLIRGTDWVEVEKSFKVRFVGAHCPQKCSVQCLKTKNEIRSMIETERRK